MFIDNVFKVRKAWRLNQSDFAALFGVSKMAYQSYESGRNSPSVDFMLKLEDMTGVSVRRLWREEIHLKDIPDSPLNGESETVAAVASEPTAVYGEILNLKKSIEDLERRVLSSS